MHTFFLYKNDRNVKLQRETTEIPHILDWTGEVQCKSLFKIGYFSRRVDNQTWKSGPLKIVSFISSGHFKVCVKRLCSNRKHFCPFCFSASVDTAFVPCVMQSWPIARFAGYQWVTQGHSSLRRSCPGCLTAANSATMVARWSTPRPSLRSTRETASTGLSTA